MSVIARLMIVLGTLALVAGCGEDGSDRELAHPAPGDAGGTAVDEDHDAARHADEGDSPDEDDEEHHDEDVLRLDGDALDEFGVRLATAAPGAISSTLMLSGEIVLNPDAIAHVAARAGGIGLGVHATVGDRVSSGDLLAVLESPALAEAKSDFLARTAEAALARTDLDRAELIHDNTVRLLAVIGEGPELEALQDDLAGLDIGANRSLLVGAYADLLASEAAWRRESALRERAISSESDFLEAQSAYKKASATFESVRDDLAFSNRRQLEAASRAALVAEVAVRAAERRLHGLGLDEAEVARVESEPDIELGRYEIHAPIDGLIIERHLVTGESVDAGREVFVVVDLSTVWAQLTVYQRDLALVRDGQQVRIDGSHGVGEASATIAYVSPILDERTRTTTARAVLDNAAGAWRPGMFVRAALATGETPAGVVVARSAVTEIEGEPTVFVETDEGLEPRHVRLGASDADRVEVVEGLAPGERYVETGVLALKAELDKASLEHAGHAH